MIQTTARFLLIVAAFGTGACAVRNNAIELTQTIAETDAVSVEQSLKQHHLDVLDLYSEAEALTLSMRTKLRDLHLTRIDVMSLRCSAEARALVAQARADLRASSEIKSRNVDSAIDGALTGFTANAIRLDGARKALSARARDNTLAPIDQSQAQADLDEADAEYITAFAVEADARLSATETGRSGIVTALQDGLDSITQIERRNGTAPCSGRATTLKDTIRSSFEMDTDDGASLSVDGLKIQITTAHDSLELYLDAVAESNKELNRAFRIFGAGGGSLADTAAKGVAGRVLRPIADLTRQPLSGIIDVDAVAEEQTTNFSSFVSRQLGGLENQLNEVVRDATGEMSESVAAAAAEAISKAANTESGDQ